MESTTALSRLSESGKQDPVPAIESDDIEFKHGARFLTRALSVVKPGEIILATGRSGASKTTIGLLAAIDGALQNLRSLIVTTEMTREQMIGRLLSLTDQFPKRKRDRVLSMIEIEDRITDVQMLPTFMLRQFGERSVNGSALNLLVIDSLHGTGVSPNSGRVYQKVYQLWGLCRSARVIVLAIAHVTKANQMAGPSSLAHSSDAILHLHPGGETRWLTTIKNRYGEALGEPIALKMTSRGKLMENLHIRPLTGIAKTILPGAGCVSEVQVSLGIPKLGQQPNLSCPSLPRGQIAQLLKSIKKLPWGFSAEDFAIEVQVVGHDAFEKSLHLPVALAAMASFRRMPLPKKVLSLGQIDLDLRVRPLHDSVATALVRELDLGSIPDGSTLIVPSADLSAVAEIPARIEIVGVDNLMDAVQSVWTNVGTVVP